MTTDTTNNPADQLAHAKQLGLVPALLRYRALAFSLDCLIWAVLYTPAAIGVYLRVQNTSSTLGLILIIAGAVASTVFTLVQLIVHGKRGVTVGKALMRLRSVSLQTLKAPGFGRVLLRALVLWGSGIVPILGPTFMFLSALRSPQRQSILDKVAKCWVIDAKAGLDPQDERALRRAQRTLNAPLREIAESLTPMRRDWEFHMYTAPIRSNGGVVGLPQPQLPEAEAPVPAAASAPQRFFIFDDGSLIDPSTPGIMGRDPQTADSSLSLIQLSDPSMALSKSHLSYGTLAEGVWIADMHSANGTEVLDASGAIQKLTPGKRILLQQGQTVHVGGRAFRYETS